MRILILNQCFYPDYVATALYTRDLALELKRRGHEVTVLAGNRGYDKNELKFPLTEEWMGIKINRVWTFGFGKSTLWRRLLDTFAFWTNATITLFMMPSQDVVVSLTTPPLISILGTFFSLWHRCRSVVWVMDLNPDQAVAKGILRKGGFPERILSALMQFSLHQADRVVVLDRYMSERLREKDIADEIISIIPPWSLDQVMERNEDGCKAFRLTHSLVNKFVVMYAGNHSPCHPLDTLLGAALSLKDEPLFEFLFVGSGSEQLKARSFANRHGLSNIACLPYQAPEDAASWLPAANMQVVVMGNEYVGIVHPCKIYNILSFGVPFLAIGPEHSHLGDIVTSINEEPYANLCLHGDTEKLVKIILKIADAGNLPPSRKLMSLASRYSCPELCPKVANVITSA